MAHVRGSNKRMRTENNVFAAASDWEGLQQYPAKILGDVVYKISRNTFDYICALVNDDMMTKPACFVFTSGKPMSLCDQVAVALRRLGSGESLALTGAAVGLNPTTVSQVTWQFVESMEERAKHHLRWPSTEMEMNAIKSKFEKIQGLPNCYGVIDYTHITLCLASSEPSYELWFDHKKKHSMVMQAVVDPDMKFMNIITGWPGIMKGYDIFNYSNFKIKGGEILNGKSLQLSEGSEIREYIIGDSGYPLLPYLVVPYKKNEELSENTKAEFNRLHFETRMVAQRALAMLKETWRIIHGIMWRPDTDRLPSIILVCCMLHNILIDMQDQVLDEVSLSHEHDYGYNQLICKAVDEKGVALRENLCLYLTGRLHA